jgi:hypothetical protein
MKIEELKAADWIMVERPRKDKNTKKMPGPFLSEIFPTVDLRCVYNWRHRERKGLAREGFYPKSKRIGGNTYVYVPSMIEFLNKKDSQKKAS